VKHRELTEKIIGCAYRVLMAICLCIALFAVDESARGQWPEVKDRRSEVRDQEFCEEKFEYFNDFIVHLKDDRKKDRILVCDVVIELSQGMKLPEERIELRKIIYNTLKKPSDLHEIRRSLKEKIKIILNNFMGAEIIKNVFFPKFILL